MANKRIAVLVSGGGTNLQALIDAQSRGEIVGGEIAAVISSAPGAFALERAAKAGIPGYVIARKDSLSEDQLARYQGCYCGLCNALKAHFGALHRLALNYDMTFLILLLSSLYEPEEQADSARCAVHPAKPQAFWQNRFSAYAADLTIALTYHKLRDDWLDEGDRLKKGLMDQLQGAYDQVKTRLPRQCEAIEQELKNNASYTVTVKTYMDYDRDGLVARGGTRVEDLFAKLNSLEYYSRKAPKS